jgi:hypothetical protein
VNQLKLGLAVAGFIVALLSVAYDERMLGWAAIVLLLGSLGLRLWLRRRGSRGSEG